MARGFGATLGAGTTDKITSALATASTLRSYAIRMLKNGDGASSNGCIWRQDLVNNSLTDLLDYQSSTLRYVKAWTTSEVGLWTIVVPSSSVWHSIVLTYNSGSPANTPVIYVDGASVAVTTAVAPVGTLVEGGLSYQLGNSTTNDRNWDGGLADFAVANRIWTPGEAIAITKGYSPLFFGPLAEHIPMIRDNVSSKLAAPTITGTAVQPHPRLILPSRVHYSPLAAVPVVVPGVGQAGMRVVSRATRGG